MKNLRQKTMLILLLMFPLFTLTACSSDDNQSPTPPDKENPSGNDTETSVFEGKINLIDEDMELDFKATGDNAKAMFGDIDLEGTEIPNLLFFDFEADDTPQKLTLLATGVDGAGTYTMGEGDFEVGAFSMYYKDKENTNIANAYTFHDQTIEFNGEEYKTDMTLKISSLTEGRVKGTLDIVMYSSVVEDGGSGGFVHKGTVQGEFDCQLIRP